MNLDFVLCELPGSVAVTVERNLDPDVLGCRPAAKDFPVCTAAVTYAGKGYRAALGWVQLVRSTDGESAGEEFELDPFEPLGRLPHPFCWFGFAPVLFDAPSREARDPMLWMAHSFLCFLHEGPDRLQVCAVLGFSWGFTIREETISLKPAEALASADWDAHLSLLRREHPAYEFVDGYRDG